MPRAGIEPTSLGFMSECDTTTLSRQPCWQQSHLNDMQDILTWVTQFNFSSRLNNLQGKLRGSETDAMFKDKYIKYETVFFKHNANSQMQVYSEKLTGSNEGYTLQVKKQIYEMVTCNNGKTSSEKKTDVMPRAIYIYIHLFSKILLFKYIQDIYIAFVFSSKRC